MSVASPVNHRLTDEPAAALPRIVTVAGTDFANYFAAAAFALGQAVQINDGALQPAALAWVFIAGALVLLPLSGIGIKRLSGLPFAGLCAAFIGIQWTELTVWGLRWLTGTPTAIAVFGGGLCIAAAGALVMLRSPQRRVLSMGLLLVGYLLIAGHAIRSKPNPPIDVWQFQQASTAALLRGENPYGVRYRHVDHDPTHYAPGMVVDGWMTTSYPYPPLTLMVTAPARALVGDVRWAYVLALGLAAVLIAACATTPANGCWMAAMLLLSPRGLLVITWGWTEPLVILAMVATVWCACRAPRWLWLAIGLLLASKQYSVLMVPLMVMLIGAKASWQQAVRTLALAAAVAICITLPFLLWNPKAFIDSVLLMQFRQPFRMDALSFTAMFAVITGIQIGPMAGFAAAAGAVIVTMRRLDWTPAGFAAAAAIVLLAFFAFNKQAFCNYYYLVIGCCCVAAIMPGCRKMTPSMIPAPRPHERL